MTAPEGQEEKTAAIGFVAFMSLALGPIGFLVAAISVGLERAWGGNAPERDRARERGQGWLGEQKDWLAADHRDRENRRQKRRDWLNSGADPEAEPSKPRMRRRLRSGVRRAVARMAIVGSDFAAGARDGWKAAREVRRNGGSLRATAKARPMVCTECRRPRAEVVEAGLCADCLRAEDARWKRPADETQPPSGGPATIPGEEDKDRALPDGYEVDAHDGPSVQPCTQCGRSVVLLLSGLCSSCRLAAMRQKRLDDNNRTGNEGDDMAAPTPTTPQAATESNASVLGAKLGRVLTGITNQIAITDDAVMLARRILYKAGAADDFAGLTGQAGITVSTLDAATDASRSTEQAMADASEALAHVEAALRKAIEAQEVVYKAEGDLASVGADGRAVADAPAIN